MGQTEIHRRMERFNMGETGWALKGFDPVGYFEGWAQKGKDQFALTHKGVRYRFSSDEHLREFRDDPEKYEPACGGWCAFAMLRGERVDIHPKRFKKIGGRMYFFYDGLLNDSLKKWDRLAEDESEQTLADRADAEWRKMLEE